MRYARGHKEQMYERLLSEAAAIIRLEGPEGLSVATLMKRVGLTHGGFYVHFRSRDDLLEKAIDHMLRQRAEFVASLDHDDPRIALRQIVDSYVSPKLIGVNDDACPIPLLAGEHHRLPEAARDRFTLGVERLGACIRELAIKAGIAVTSDTVDSVVAELIGAASLARVQASDHSGRRFLSAARKSVLAKLHLSSRGGGSV